MALCETRDITNEFVAGNGYTIDMSNWDNAVWQFVSPSGTISTTATNDGGAVQGSTDGNSKSALNYQTTQVTKLEDGTAVTAVAAAGLYRHGVIGRYVKFGGSGAAATKVIVMLHKVS